MDFKNNKIGIISYNHAHLKTEQVLNSLVMKNFHLKLYLLPFNTRPARKTLFSHRPRQDNAIHPQLFASYYNLEVKLVANDVEIDDECSLYLILGAGLLSKECCKNKKIINSHPGLIPASRGLDSFKWSILENTRLGNTLHYINEDVDSGEIISRVETPVYRTDSIEQLASRHYQYEINLLSNFDYFLTNPVDDTEHLSIGEPKRRMNLDIERKMLQHFPNYVNLIAYKL